MYRLTQPEKVVNRLAELDRSMAWLGRQVHRSRQRISGLVRSPDTTLVPGDLAAEIAATLGYSTFDLFEQAVEVAA